LSFYVLYDNENSNNAENRKSKIAFASRQTSFDSFDSKQ
jgi:hypothetical protein